MMSTVPDTRWPHGVGPFLWLTLRRTLGTILRGEVIGALFWPVLVASLLWLVVGALLWEPVTTMIGSWLEEVNGATSSGESLSWWSGALIVGVKFALWLGVIPLIYVTALVLLAVWTLPHLIRRIAQRDYPALTFCHGGSAVGSLINTLTAASLYLLGLLGTLLLWWIPGALLLFPFLLTAWLNQRTFVYDCLSEVADGDELRRVAERYRGWLFVVGLVGAALLWLPVVNLLSPVLIATLFAHATLELLQWERGVVTPHASSSSTWELLP
jgi:hypothetical protein